MHNLGQIEYFLLTPPNVVQMKENIAQALTKLIDDMGTPDTPIMQHGQRKNWTTVSNLQDIHFFTFKRTLLGSWNQSESRCGE